MVMRRVHQRASGAANFGHSIFAGRTREDAEQMQIGQERLAMNVSTSLRPYLGCCEKERLSPSSCYVALPNWVMCNASQFSRRLLTGREADLIVYACP
jgi:hypothetical protein